MERECSRYRECRRTLSELVPEHIDLCSEHQILRLDIQKYCRRWGVGKDADFVFENWRGCWPFDLRSYLDLDPNLFYERLRDGFINTCPPSGGRSITIPAEEIVRIISLCKVFVPIAIAADKIYLPQQQLEVLAVEYELIPYSYNLSKELCIDGRKIDDLAILCRLMAKDGEISNLKIDGHMSIDQFAEATNVDRSIVCRWFNDFLSTKKIGKALYVSTEEIKSFVIDVFDGRYAIPKKWLIPLLQDRRFYSDKMLVKRCGIKRHN